VLLSVGVAPGSPECLGVMQRLSQRGYPTADISDIELAQVQALGGSVQGWEGCYAEGAIVGGQLDCHCCAAAAPACLCTRLRLMEQRPCSLHCAERFAASWRKCSHCNWNKTTNSSRQVHLRHLVGGRARGPQGELPNERIFQVWRLGVLCRL